MPSEDSSSVSLESYSFLPEWEPHEAVWMGWAEESEPPPVKTVFPEMAKALTPLVRVVIGCTEATEAEARKALADAPQPVH